MYLEELRILSIGNTKAVIRSCSINKVFLEISQNSQENTYARVSFLLKLQAIKKETLSTFFTEHLRVTAFGNPSGIPKHRNRNFCKKNRIRALDNHAQRSIQVPVHYLL